MNEDPNSNDQVFLCGRDFVQKCYLDMHMKLHEEAKLPQKCETGSKKFTSKQHLLQHIDKFHESLHADENFQSSMYKKVFLRRHLLLNQRLRSHQRQYFCKYCPKSFSLQHNLVKNLKKHIPEE
ncbi:hypothetical protein JTB14_036776 [Gonioctena quinquepunctata]|nr:hypothetical protein JTB14_036776 [Gonioctena quinquepunctata]